MPPRRCTTHCPSWTRNKMWSTSCCMRKLLCLWSHFVGTRTDKGNCAIFLMPNKMDGFYSATSWLCSKLVAPVYWWTASLTENHTENSTTSRTAPVPSAQWLKVASECRRRIEEVVLCLCLWMWKLMADRYPKVWFLAVDTKTTRAASWQKIFVTSHTIDRALSHNVKLYLPAKIRFRMTLIFWFHQMLLLHWHGGKECIHYLDKIRSIILTWTLLL